MLRASSSRLVQSGLHRNLKCASLARTAGSVRQSSSEADGEPSFIQMCEIFLDNARSYVEHRLLTRPDPPGTKKNPYEDKKSKIKGLWSGFYMCSVVFATWKLWCSQNGTSYISSGWSTIGLSFDLLQPLIFLSKLETFLYQNEIGRQNTVVCGFENDWSSLQFIQNECRSRSLVLWIRNSILYNFRTFLINCSFEKVLFYQTVDRMVDCFYVRCNYVIFPQSSISKWPSLYIVFALNSYILFRNNSCCLCRENSQITQFLSFSRLSIF